MFIVSESGCPCSEGTLMTDKVGNKICKCKSCYGNYHELMEEKSETREQTNTAQG